MASVLPQVQLENVPPFMLVVSPAAFHENISVCQGLPMASHPSASLALHPSASLAITFSCNYDSLAGFPFPSMEHLKASAAFNYFVFFIRKIREIDR